MFCKSNIKLAILFDFEFGTKNEFEEEAILEN